MSQKPHLLTLQSTFEGFEQALGLDELVDLHLSPAMHDLYLSDLPDCTANPEIKQRLAVIGPNDYFYKWQGDEFQPIAQTSLAHWLNYVQPSYAHAAQIEQQVTGIPLFGGNHQLMFINTDYIHEIPRSFEQLLEQTWLYRNSNRLLYPWVFPTNACYFILPLLYGYGAPLWSDPEQPTLGISHSALTKTLSLLRRLMYDDILLPVKWEQYHSVFEFQSRRAAICFGGDWDIRDHQQKLGSALGVAPIPSLERECRSTANCQYLFVSSSISQPMLDQLDRMLGRLLNPTSQTALLDQRYRYPVLRDYKLYPQRLSGLVQISHHVFQHALFLPPDRSISQMFHVLGDLLEPGVLVRYDFERLVDRAYRCLLEPTWKLDLRNL